MKKLVFAAVAVLAVFSLSACSYDPSEGTSSNPVSADERYSTDSYELEDGFAITCLTKGFGKTAVLASVEAQDGAELTPIAESPYSVNYVKFEDGRIIPCLSKGFGETSVLSCVVQPR